MTAGKIVLETSRTLLVTVRPGTARRLNMTTTVDKNILGFACNKLKQAMSNPLAIDRYLLLKKIEHARINTWTAGNRKK